jgi:hypothetical protein
MNKNHMGFPAPEAPNYLNSGEKGNRALTKIKTIV